MNSFLTVLIVGLTSIGVVGVGIVSAYWAVIGILEGVSYRSSPSSMASLTLASESQAGGD